MTKPGASTWIGGIAAIIAAAWLYRTSDALAGLGVILAAWAIRRLIAGRR